MISSLEDSGSLFPASSLPATEQGHLLTMKSDGMTPVFKVLQKLPRVAGGKGLS